MISQEVLSKVAERQEQFWQTVSLVLTEAVGKPVAFSDATTDAIAPAGAFDSEEPLVSLVFGLGPQSDHSMAVLMPESALAGLWRLVKDEEPTAVAPSDVQTQLEAIAQGLGLAVGNALNAPMAPTDVTIRAGTSDLPAEWGSVEQLLRTTVKMVAEGLAATVSWLMTSEAASVISGSVAPDEAAEEAEEAEVAELELTGRGPETSEEAGRIDMLMDIPLEISVELGRVRMLIRDVLSLGPGSVVEIDRAAGEAVDVLVNGLKVARGEVVVIEDNFGVRVTQILSQEDRIARLGEAA